MLSRLIAGVRALLSRRRDDQDLADELRGYLEESVERKLGAGMGRADALRAARVEMGSPAAIKDGVRDVGWESWVEGIWRDIRYALRGLRRSPGFTAVAILTLALGIGANTAIYSAIDAAFFRPLPFPQPDQLVRVTEVMVPIDFRGLTKADGSDEASSPPPKSRVELTDLYEARGVFSESAAHATGGFNLGTGPEPLRVDVTFVTTEFFAVFRRQPSLGRVFTREDMHAGDPKVTVLSYSLWRSHFGGDPAIVGTRVTLDEVPHEVIGVMPEDFRFPAVADLWLPLPLPAPMSVMTAFRNYLPSQIVARLAPGMTPAAASERLDVIRRPFVNARPEFARFAIPTAGLVAPLQRWLVGDRRTALTILMASAGLVLLIACANVATLTLSRATTRRPEIATRLALGSSRGRLVRQLLIESVILSLGGALLGLAMAKVGLSALSTLLPPQLAGLAPPMLDLRVLAFTMGVAVSTGVVFGISPASGSSRQEPGDALSSSRSRVVNAAGRMKSGLVVAEVALACLLVVAAGLMLTSLRSLLATDMGMRVDLVATARLNLPSGTYQSHLALAEFIRSALLRLREAPGVDEAAAINTLPLTQESGINLRVSVEGPSTPFDEESFAPYLVVSPGYFRTMGIALLDGRDLAWTDGPSAPVAVVNRTLARALSPGGDVIGRRFAFGTERDLRTVVGVVENARISDLNTEAGFQVYLPIQEQPQQYLSLVARTTEADNVQQVLPHIGAAVRRVDPALPIYAAQPMEAVLGSTIAPRRLNTLLIGTFGALALCMAAIGIFGVLAYSVAQRTREIGVRMALGAQRTEVMSLVIRQGMAMASIGVGLGIVAALGTTRFLQGMLHGVTPRDPATFIAVALLFSVVALLASSIPGWRATRIDPLSALRCE